MQDNTGVLVLPIVGELCEILNLSRVWDLEWYWSCEQLWVVSDSLRVLRDCFEMQSTRLAWINKFLAAVYWIAAQMDAEMNGVF